MPGRRVLFLGLGCLSDGETGFLAPTPAWRGRQLRALAHFSWLAASPERQRQRKRTPEQPRGCLALQEKRAEKQAAAARERAAVVSASAGAGGAAGPPSLCTTALGSEPALSPPGQLQRRKAGRSGPEGAAWGASGLIFLSQRRLAAVGAGGQS